MELPFAVDSPERTSQFLSTFPGGEDSLVSVSSQGSFLTSSGAASSMRLEQQQQQQHHQQQQPAMTNVTSSTGSHPTPSPSFGHALQPRPSSHPPSNMVSNRATHRGGPVVAAPSLPRPSSTTISSSGGITSGLNIFGTLRAFGSSKVQPQQPPQPQPSPSLETIDFTYVTVSETDADEVDITLEGNLMAVDGNYGGHLGSEEHESKRGDILTLLLSGAVQQQQDGDSDNDSLVRQCEEANHAAFMAAEAKREGDLQGALEAHARAAKQFHEAAVLVKDRNESMANSLLLLCQTQAKSALALKRIVKQSPLPHDSNPADAKNPRSKIITQKDRLRAAVRGALVTRNEEEMSDSAFLGKATKGPMTASPGHSSTQVVDSSHRSNASPSAGSTACASAPQHNPVDDMMELERQLKDMDLTLEMGNSIASLDARTQSRLKSSIGVDGSFMVVPGAQSYMSSSNMWSAAPSLSQPTGTSGNTSARSNTKTTSSRTAASVGTAGVRARANRVQNLVGASTSHPRSPPQLQQTHQPQHRTASAAPAAGLESSWWGTSSTASQVLSASVISLGASSIRTGAPHEGGRTDSSAAPANTKQLMRLMDALKTLGDENANLLREVEQAEAARMEAKAAKEQMARFKHEYSTRFEHLKAALKKFRESNPETGCGSAEVNLVINSDYMRSASTTEQLQRQEQLIRKLTADLKKEKEESHKKDMALGKYENFYREVKARSAAKQRQRETTVISNQRPPQPKSGGRKTAGHR